MNTFGTLFRLTDFGESHGPAIGGVVDGMPPGIAVDFEAINAMLARRRPGSGAGVSARREDDKPEFLSGIFEGRTLGTPIGFIIRNKDCRSEDYEALRTVYRPNHADYTYQAKYGLRDHRGGGRASARETAVRIVAGALALQVLAGEGISVSATTDFPDAATIEAVRAKGDSIGAIVSCRITGVPVGLGEPVFGKLHAMLAAAMMSINAAKGFEYGDGFAAARMTGSESADIFTSDDGAIRTLTNHSGGIQGGISNGADIVFRVAFKPIASIPQALPTIDEQGRPATVATRGRHDVCVAPRVLPVVEAMAAMTILDALMLSRSML